MYTANTFTLYIITTVRKCSRVGYALMNKKKKTKKSNESMSVKKIDVRKTNVWVRR